MTKNEALKAAIDGKKIRNKCWTTPQDVYIFWDGNKFLFADGFHFQEENMQSRIHDGWQIVPEYVDFATAWKAYEEWPDRKTIQDEFGKKYKKIQNGCNFNFFGETAIRGKWLILEDE